RRETRDERRETRDERRETRDERRETRDERRETRDALILSFEGQIPSTPFRANYLPTNTSRFLERSVPEPQSATSCRTKSVLRFPKTKKRQSLDQRFLNLLSNFSVLTLCKCMALEYLEEYLASSKQLGR
ncbi:hypothetical protein E1100_23070, partial [Vibrio owensii]